MKKVLIMLVVWLLPGAMECSAQDIRSFDAGAIQSNRNETLEMYKLEDSMSKKKEAPEKPVEEEDVQPEGGSIQKPEDVSFFLDKVETGKSELLSGEELSGITGKYEGKLASIDDLFKMVDEINALYASKGVKTAKAFLPPQKVEKGVVRVRLVESRVEDIKLEGNDHTADWFILDRMPVNIGDVVMVDKLEREILFFNTLFDVKLKAELTRGKEFGTTDITLVAKEPPNYQIQLYADNSGKSEVGEERGGVILHSPSLFGLRDPLTLGGNYADGIIAASVSYNLPVNKYGTRVGAYYDYNQVKINQGPFAEVDIDGRSDDIGVFVGHPFIVKPRMKLDGFARVNIKDSKTRFETITIFDTQVRSLSYGANVQFFSEDGIWYTTHEFTDGFKEFGGDKSFLRYRMSLVTRQFLGSGLSLLLRLSGQWSDSNLLPPSEQFQIGGMTTVRGYSEGILIGDNGYAASAELNLPLFFLDWRVKGFTFYDKIKGAVFVDHGGAFPFKGNDQSITHDDFLTGVGFGFVYEFSKYLSGRVYLGVPLGERETGQNDVKVHFYVQSIPF